MHVGTGLRQSLLHVWRTTALVFAPQQLVLMAARSWRQRKARKLASAAISRLGYPYQQTSPDLWLATGVRVKRRNVTIAMAATGETVQVVASARLFVCECTIPHWILWDLLHMNSSLGSNQFCLTGEDNSCQIVSTCDCRADRSSPAEIAHAAKRAMHAIEFLILHLYERAEHWSTHAGNYRDTSF
jgi:hypothetical protein